MRDSQTESGFVLRIQGADFFVASGPGIVRCTLRGRFRLEESPEEVLPVVGDDVTFRMEEHWKSGGPSGLITSILPRRSVFARSAVSGKRRARIIGANLDYVILVFAVAEPRFNVRLVDRMLVAAESGRMEPILCINKTDLTERFDTIDERLAAYRGMNYRVILCSALTGEGLGVLERLMRGKKSIMVGPSGTGKTSIVAAVQPGLKLKVKRVSDRTGKGRHATTHIELHPLDGGGYLGDTPGIREFGIWGVSQENLDEFFKDFDSYRDSCRFVTCTHSHEPGCAVKDAVDKSLITQTRYESYLRILATVPKEI